LPIKVAVKLSGSPVVVPAAINSKPIAPHTLSLMVTSALPSCRNIPVLPGAAMELPLIVA